MSLQKYIKYLWVLTIAAPLIAQTATVTNVSLTPTSGGGASQIFTATYRDVGSPAPNVGGTGNIIAYLLINSTTATTHACEVQYNARAARWQLKDDLGNWVLGSTQNYLSNSQCVFWYKGSYAIPLDANTLAVSFMISFKGPTFTGTAKNTYLLSYDAGTGIMANGGALQQFGSFLPAIPAISLGTVTPNSGSGQDQSFTATFNDTAGFQSIYQAHIMFSTSPTGYANACYVMYQASTDGYTWLSVLNDAGTAWLPLIQAGTDTNVGNTQCTLHGLGSGIGIGATNSNLGVAISLTFNWYFFHLQQNIYLYAWDMANNLNTGSFAATGVKGTFQPASPTSTNYYPNIPPTNPGTNGTGGGFNALPGSTGNQFTECIYLDDKPYPIPNIPVYFNIKQPACKSGGHTHDLCNGQRPPLTYRYGTVMTDGNGCATNYLNLPSYAGVNYTDAQTGPVPYPPPNQNQTFVVSDVNQWNGIQLVKPFPLGDSVQMGWMRGMGDSNHGGMDTFNLDTSMYSVLTKIGSNYQKLNAAPNTLFNPYPCSATPSTPIRPRFFIIHRASLPWGGWLESPGLMQLWGTVNVDAHPTGMEFDVENPGGIINQTCEGKVLINYLYQAITDQGCSMRVPGSTTKPGMNDPIWHAQCLSLYNQ